MVSQSLFGRVLGRDLRIVLLRRGGLLGGLWGRRCSGENRVSGAPYLFASLMIESHLRGPIFLLIYRSMICFVFFFYYDGNIVMVDALSLSKLGQMCLCEQWNVLTRLNWIGCATRAYYSGKERIPQRILRLGKREKQEVLELPCLPSYLPVSVHQFARN